MIENFNVLKAMCHEKPYATYARLFGYKEDEKRGSCEFAKKVNFKLFATEPNIANEFISDFYNKVVAQWGVDLFEQKPLEMKFSRFLRTYDKVGDIEEYIATKLQTVVNYDEDTTPTNPFEVNKPQIVLSFIKTEDKEFAFVTLNYEQWYGAFINEGGLTNLAQKILKNLDDAIGLDIYYKIVKDLGDTTKFTKTHTITAITGAGDGANARKAYEEIMALRAKMNLPSKTGEFSPSGLENTGTPYSRMVLYLNTKYTASFDINVLASLFNSSKIKLDVETIEFDTKATNVVGILMDERSYVYGQRINFVQSIMNPRNMFINTFNHKWIKRGIVPFYNAVILKDSAV